MSRLLPRALSCPGKLSSQIHEGGHGSQPGCLWWMFACLILRCTGWGVPFFISPLPTLSPFGRTHAGSEILQHIFSPLALPSMHFAVLYQRVLIQCHASQASIAWHNSNSHFFYFRQLFMQTISKPTPNTASLTIRTRSNIKHWFITARRGLGWIVGTKVCPRHSLFCLEKLGCWNQVPCSNIVRGP